MNARLGVEASASLFFFLMERRVLLAMKDSRICQIIVDSLDGFIKFQP